nr:serine/threonine-protein kinase [Pseudenhygromyxa sp. WMMC2535]
MDLLGGGSQGHTYRAIDRSRGDEVAVKVFTLGGQHDWKAFELFEREVEVLRSLKHRGIPRFRDSFASEQSGDYFLVMELVEGQTLAELMKKPGSFEAADLRRVLLDTLDILDYLHSRSPPVIHRDIKPANLLRSADGQLHLVDFGGVRVAIRPEGGSTMIGTFGYMAPEQLHGDAGPAVDLYALGATVTALAAGRPADELPHQGLAIDLDALSVPASLREVLEALLQPDPRDRPQSVAEARALIAGRANPRTGAHRSTGAHANTGAQPSTGAALAVPEFVQELAEVPKPMSILVWLGALAGTLGLLVFEYALLPIIYLVMRAVADDKRRKGRTADHDEANISSLKAMRRNMSRNRLLMQHVLHSTSPMRDDPPALPPDPRDRH